MTTSFASLARGDSATHAFYASRGLVRETPPDQSDDESLQITCQRVSVRTEIVIEARVKTNRYSFAQTVSIHSGIAPVSSGVRPRRSFNDAERLVALTGMEIMASNANHANSIWSK